MISAIQAYHPCEMSAITKEMQDNNQHKLIIHLRLLKIIDDTASLNNSSVVSNVYTPTIPHLNTYAASRQSGIPIHHVPTISVYLHLFWYIKQIR